MAEEDMEEVFQNPSVVEVVFEVRFPHLFYINQKIGDFQLEIMDDFPKSSQILEEAIFIGAAQTTLTDEEKPKPTQIWQFESENGKNRIMVRPNRLNIISHEYKSYNSPTVEKRFRNLIKDITTTFIEKVPIKTFSRLGIRYIDHCPLEEQNNEYFRRFYKPIFEIEEYNIENIIENRIAIRIKKGDYYLLFQCGIRKVDEVYKYVLDYDGYAMDVAANNFINITDELKKIIKKEYYSNITEEFKNYMRSGTT